MKPPPFQALPALCALLLGFGASAQDSLTLRSSVTLAPGSPVTIADIADVRGEQAQSLRAVVVLDAASAAKRDPDGFLSISLADIRSVLMNRKDVNLGRLSLSGGRVRVIFGSASVTAPSVLPVAAAGQPHRGECAPRCHRSSPRRRTNQTPVGHRRC